MWGPLLGRPPLPCPPAPPTGRRGRNPGTPLKSSPRLTGREPRLREGCQVLLTARLCSGPSSFLNLFC